NWNCKLGAALIKVRRFIRWEFCRWHLGMKKKEEHRFANPCSHPRAGCPITSAGWPWAILHLDNFDALPTQLLSKFRGCTGIGDQTSNSLVGADLRNASS